MPPTKDEQQCASNDDYQMEALEYGGGAFRGIAATMRASLPALRGGVRAVGSARPLAFASEVGVAAQSMIPRAAYVGAWGLSGAAVAADIATKVWDAPPEKRLATAGYHTAFHIPASLVIPAVIIHKIVHATEHLVQHKPAFKNLPPRAKALLPVGAALVSIVPVVPVVDHSCEAIMEPTLGKYLEIEFHHEH